jgi:hypothetical protein
VVVPPYDGPPVTTSRKPSSEGLGTHQYTFVRKGLRGFVQKLAGCREQAPENAENEKIKIWHEARNCSYITGVERRQ